MAKFNINIKNVRETSEKNAFRCGTKATDINVNKFKTAIDSMSYGGNCYCKFNYRTLSDYEIEHIQDIIDGLTEIGFTCKIENTSKMFPTLVVTW